MQRVEQFRIEPIEPRLALEPQVESARANAVGQRQRAIAIHGEQRVAEDDVGSLEPLAVSALSSSTMLPTERAR